MRLRITHFPDPGGHLPATFCLLLLSASSVFSNPAEIEVAKISPAKASVQDGIATPAPSGDQSVSVDFMNDVWPILESNCIGCHGPEKQKNGLRVDDHESLLKGGDYGAAVVPGNAEGSFLYRVVAGIEEDVKMPPSGEGLTTEEIATLRRWIEQGGEFSESFAEEKEDARTTHWAFQPISQPSPPQVKNQAWVRNPIDAFVLAGLEEKEVEPSPQADRWTLGRRLHLDLTGLPPAPEEIQRFVEDESPYAYESLVNSLLSSPHFGERWGRHWLDAARYADSDGYEKDRVRPHAWRYRDWVIDAFNRDLPYDRFLTEQIAGDLLPAGGVEACVATGFHRNTLTNLEGGVDREEDRVKQTVDRTNTTASVFLGLTMACANCHSHKYDPLSQREYFGLYGFFNTAIEKDIPAPVEGEERAYREAKAHYESQVAKVEKEISKYEKVLEERLPTWEAANPLGGVQWEVLDPASMSSEGGAKFRKLGDGTVLVGGFSPETDAYTVVVNTELKKVSAIRLEALTDDLHPRGGPGRAKHGNFILSEFEVTASKRGFPEVTQKVEFASAKADHHESGWEIEKAFDGKTDTGWSIEAFEEGNNIDRKALFISKEDAGFEEGTTLRIQMKFSYGGQHTLGAFRLFAGSGDRELLDIPPSIPDILATATGERTEGDKKQLLEFFGTQDPRMRELQATLQGLREGAPAAPNTQAQTLAANPESVTTHIHIRGDFLRPGDVVQPHTPAVLPPLKARGEIPDRLDLANWMVSPENPLTARVAVNRVWQHLFGRGIVETAEDFGTMGEMPTHPELLDWLASEYMQGGWSQKDLIRKIVTSNTYRQSSDTRPELVNSDPKNHWLARQNRFRVEAEIVRDLSLASSGLLNREVGGPSIRPPLPPGLADLGYAGQVKWEEDTDANKYRRGLYIFFQRTVPYPMLMTFDCPDSNVTVLRRNVSNTPLQALTTLNNPVFVECAKNLGARLLANEEDTESRIRRAFLLCLSRPPDSEEIAMMSSLLADQREIFKKNPEQAGTVLASLSFEQVPEIEAAAWVELARVMMNLDEFFTRE